MTYFVANHWQDIITWSKQGKLGNVEEGGGHMVWLVSSNHIFYNKFYPKLE